MVTVPVWRTVGETLQFVFGRYLAILGAVWLPLLVLATCEYFVFLPIVGALPTLIAQAVHHPYARIALPEIASMQRFVPLVDLIVLLVGAWMAVGVTKEALGLRGGVRFVYLSIGAAEFWLLAAYLIVVAFVLGGAIAIAIVALIVFLVGGAMLWNVPASSGIWDHLDFLGIGTGCALGLVVLCVVLCVVIYFGIRFLALLLPVTVAEKRLGFMRSWELSKGNFWRLFAVGLITFLLRIAAELVVIGGIVAYATTVAIANAPTLHHNHTDVAATVGAILVIAKRYLPAIGIFFFAVAPIFLGLQIAPWSFAYRSLVPEARPDGDAA